MSFISDSQSDQTTILPSDPKVIGPGVWFTIHSTAKRATNEAGKKAFVDLMNDLAERFPCPKCRQHIQEYLSTNPIKAYWDLKRKQDKTGTDEEIGMFTWAWNFHNAVNSRLTAAGNYKPYVDFDTAWNLYTDSGISVCTKGCGEESEGVQGVQGVQGARPTQQQTPQQPQQQQQQNNNYLVAFNQHQPQTLIDEHRVQPSLLKALSPSLFS